MGAVAEVSGVEHILEGEWRVGASNIEPWVNGMRRNPVIRFSVGRQTPLTLIEEQSYLSKEGKQRTSSLTSRFTNGEFISKGRRLLAPMSRWSVSGVSADGSTVVIRMTHERGGQDGLLVLVRTAEPMPELRTSIALGAEGFGVGPEDFASLTWLPTA